MLACVNMKGYVLVSRGLLKCRKKINHLSVSSNFCFKTHKSELFTEENYFMSSYSLERNSSKDAVARNVNEMKLRDFLNCFYVSGWVPFHLMKECVSNFSKTDPINYELGSVLLRCCGYSLAACENSIRINVSNAVWKKFSQASDICHDQYHILLSVDAENSFYRDEVLVEMERKNVLPNQTTYDLLLQCASESNNKAAFNTLKSLLSKNNATLNDNFFSSLVRLLTLERNISEIQNIEKTFCAPGTQPSDVVTFAVLRAYASLGLFNFLFELTEKSISCGQEIKSNQLAHLIAELSYCATKDEVVQFINYIHSLGLRMAIRDVNWLTAYLTSRHFEGIAHEILKKMSWENLPAVHMDSPPATLVSLMCAFWNNDKEPNSLMKIINSVECTMRIPWTMETALHGALTHQNKESAWIILEEMHKKGTPLRSHYFWPLLLNTSCPAEMLHIIKKMCGFSVPLDTTTLKSFVIERVVPRGVNPTYLGDRLVQAGVRSKQVILAMDIYFLENDQMDVALQKIVRPKFEGSTDLIEALTSAYLRSQNDMCMIPFLKILRSDRITKTDWVGQVVVDVYSRNPALGERLFQQTQSNGITLSTDVVVLIKALREQAKLNSDKRSQDIKDYDESGNWPRLFNGTYLHPIQMNEQELENHLSELRSKGMNTRNILRKLFLVHTNKRNVKRAKELLDDLEENPNSEWSAAMLASKMQLLAMLGEADGSLDTYLEIKTKFPKFSVDAYKVVALAESLVRDDRLADALDILNDLPASPGEKLRNLTSVLVFLETSVQKKISIGDLKNLINLMIRKQYVTPSNPLMSSCVNYYLQREDFEGAVKEFQTLNQQYRLTPNKFELLCALHSAKLKGKISSFNKLRDDVLSVLKSRPDYHTTEELLPAAQAGDKEVVLSIMSRILKARDWKSIEWQCRHWATTDNVSPLELILTATRELKAKSIDMSPLILALADVYYYHGEREKIEALLRILSAGEVTCSPEVRRTTDLLSRSCGSLNKDIRASTGNELELENLCQQSFDNKFFISCW